MLTLDKVFLQYGSKVLFRDIDALINSKDRIAVVGANGTGKSTLIKIINSEISPERGKIIKDKYTTIGYLPQDGLHAHGKTLYHEVESAYDEILNLQNKIDQTNEKLDYMDPSEQEYYDLLDSIGEWENRLEDLDFKRMKSNIERILLGLGFEMNDMQRDTGEFSGGWQMRIALAKLLLKKPNILLLDEPTNHLDINSQRWMESYLRNYQGALLIISHDKAFLDSVTNRTFHLSMGELDIYSGNYSFFEKERIRRIESQRKAYQQQQREIKAQKEWIGRFSSVASKASQVQSRIKAIEKINLLQKPIEEKGIYFRFPSPPPSSQTVVTLEKLSKSYGDLKIFENLHFRIDKGDRVAVVGVNGAGKSTLARIIAGNESFQVGDRKLGVNTIMAYFAQHQADELDISKTALQEVESMIELQDQDGIQKVRSILGAMLFRGEEVHKKVGVLSGGERCRVALGKMLLQKANTIILDEPTNHLDIGSKQVLQDAIKAYQGTTIIVSHDRDFLDPIVNKVLEVRYDGTRVILGNISDYLQKIDEELVNGKGPLVQQSYRGPSRKGNWKS